MPENSQRGGAATEYSLSSKQWRRGSGRGGAPLLDPLPTPASRGEEVENAPPENCRGLRRFGQIVVGSRASRPQFYFEILQRSGRLIQKAAGPLPTLPVVAYFETGDLS